MMVQTDVSIISTSRKVNKCPKNPL